MSAPIQNNGHESAAPANSNGHAASDNPGTSLATLIQDAEALQATLTDARASIARLIAGLRRHRKQSRLGERDPEVAQAAQADRNGRVISSRPKPIHQKALPQEIQHHANEAQRRRFAKGRPTELRVSWGELQS